MIIALIHFLVEGIAFKPFIFELGIGICFGVVLLMNMLTQAKFWRDYGQFLVPFAFCTVFPIFTFGIPMYRILTIQNFEFEDLMNIVKLVVISVLTFINFVIILGFFFKYFNYISENSNESQQKNLNKEQNKDLDELIEKDSKYLVGSNFNELKNKEFFEVFKENNCFPGIITFAVYFGVFLYCLIRLLEFIQDLDFSAGFYLNLIYICLTPLMIFLGIIISRLNLRFDFKLNIFTALFGLIPTIIFLSLYLNYPEYQTIFRYFLVLPPFFTIFWSSLSTINTKTIYNWSLMFSCICIAFPIGFLLPFSLFGEFKIIPVYTFIGLFLGFPLGYFMYSIYKSIKDFISKDIFEKAEILKNTTFYKTALFIITSIFIMSEGTLLYMYFTAPNSSPATGALLSMLIILAILFILSMITLQVELDRALSFKLSISIIIILSVFCVISGILFSILGYLGNDVSSACIASTISCIILAFLSIGLIQFKYQNPEFSKLLMVICNLTLWVFFVMPLAVGLPSALSRAKDSKSRNKIIGIATIFIGIVFMVGVSIVSILYNIYQKKIENERMIIKCCNSICKHLKSNKIKCKYLTVREFYDLYSRNGFLDGKFVSKFELTDMKTKNFKIYKISETKKNIENGSNIQKRTIWEQFKCFDEKDYEKNKQRDSDSEGENDIENDKVQQIGEFELDFIDDLYCDEFIKSRAIEKYRDFEYDYKSFPKIDKIKHELEKFFESFSRDVMSVLYGKSMRIDCLGSIFDTLANEPNEVSNEKWMSQVIFLLLLRHSGITEQLISSKKIKFLYYFITMKERLRPFNKNLFVIEAFPQIAKVLYPYFDKVEREKILIVDYICANLPKNFKKLINELESQNSKNIEKKTFQENLIKTKKTDIICSLRDDHTINMDRDALRDSESASRKNHELGYYYLKIGFYLWFTKKCKKLPKFFQVISAKLERLLKNFYLKKVEISQEQSAKDIKTDGVISSIEEANTFIQKKIDKFSVKQKNKKAKQSEQKEKFAFNKPNLITIFTKILEFYQLSSIGLKKEVSWNIWREPLAKSSDLMLIENNPYFIPVFWVAFFLAICYIPVAWYSKRKIISGGIGKDAQGESQKITTAEGLRKYMIMIAGSQLYMFIIKSQLSVFACNVEELPPVLWNTNIVCYETLHIAHFFCAIACIFAYYPLATFIYPMLQFNDSVLEIKFNTTFLIILSQTKLIITAVTVFLPYQYYLKYQLSFASAALFLLFTYVTYEKPCLVTKVNIWMSAGYFMAFLTNFMGFINVQVGGSLVVNIIFFILLLITLIVTIILYCRYTLKCKYKINPSSQQDPN